MSEKDFSPPQKAREMREPDTTDIVEPSELGADYGWSRRKFLIGLVGGGSTYVVGGVSLGILREITQKKPTISHITPEQPKKTPTPETLSDRLNELNPDYSKMSEFITNYDKLYGYTPAKGWCLQGTADVLESVYPELQGPSGEPVMGELRNGHGITTASISIEKFRILPQFKELVLKPEEQNPAKIREILDQLPNGVLVGLTGEEESTGDAGTDIEGYRRNDGHISFLYNIKSEDGRVTQTNLASDGLEDLDWYFNNMAAGKYVIFVPTTDYNPQEYEAQKNKLPYIDRLISERNYEKEVIRGVTQFMALPPGGYNLSLEETDLASIYNESLASHQRNSAGTDDRSIAEIAFFARLAVTRDPQVREKYLERYPDNIVNSIDTVLGGQNWQPLGERPITSGDVMLALQGAGSIWGRTLGMDLDWDMQKKGETIKYGFEPLRDDKISWSHDNGIRPSILAWSEVMKPIAVKMLTDTADIFNDVSVDVSKVADHLSSPGTISALATKETSGGVFIGDTPVQTQWNLSPGWYPTSEHDMKEVAEMLEQNTGLPYTEQFTNKFGTEREYWQYIPGSSSGRTYDGQSGSGGAVYSQFMPSNEMDLLQRMKKSNMTFLPGTPPGMVLSWYWFLNAKFHPLQGQADGVTVLKDTYRLKGGYVRGDSASIQQALMGWNPDSNEVASIYNLAVDYFDKFGTGK